MEPKLDVERTLRLLAQAVVTIADRDMIAVGDEVRRLAASTPAEKPVPLFSVGDEVLDRGGVRHTIRTGPTWKPSYSDRPPVYQWWYETEDGCWRREKTLTKVEKHEPKQPVAHLTVTLVDEPNAWAHIGFDNGRWSNAYLINTTSRTLDRPRHEFRAPPPIDSKFLEQVEYVMKHGTCAKEPEPVIGCKLLRADGISLVGYEGRRLQYPLGAMVYDRDGIGVFIAVSGGLESATAESQPGDFVAAFRCWGKTSESNILGGQNTLPYGTSVLGVRLPNGVYTFRHVRRLPEIPMDKLHPDLRKEVEAWQARHKPAEPKPPRKYEDGRWVQPIKEGFSPGTVLGVVWLDREQEWGYKISTEDNSVDWHWYESRLKPCPPPLSDAQRRLQPGDKVRMREKRWDAEGDPSPMMDGDGWISTIITSYVQNGCIRCHLADGMGAYRREWLHNLEPAEGERKCAGFGLVAKA